MTELLKGPDEKFCFECGEVIRAKAELCPKCGIRQPGFGVQRGSPEKNRIAAGVFALLLGIFGAHKFYLGKTGQGIMYLLFFWTMIPGIIAFIEGILYLTMSDEAFEDRYLT